MAEDRSVLGRSAPPPVSVLSYGSHPDQVVDVYVGHRTPALVLVHGGYWRPEYDRMHLRPMASALADAGWTSYLIEYRREPGNPEAMLGDVRAAIAAAAADRGDGGVILVGHSAGGHLVLRVVAEGPDGVHGVLALAPLADLAAAVELNLDDGAAAAFLGAYPADQYCPMAQPAPRVPVLLLHGDQDELVPIGPSRVYAQRKPPARLQVLPGVGHFALIDPLAPTWPRVLKSLDELAQAQPIAPHADLTTTEPTTTGLTAYDQYVRTMELHGLQHTLTDAESEVAFVYISQVMELYFALIRAEFDYAIAHLQSDALVRAVVALRRATSHFEALNASWASLRWLTPMEFGQFREQLGVASGFQSWAYRHVEFMVGLKSPALVLGYAGNPAVHAPLISTLQAPSLYDEALFALSRAGMQIDPARLARDFSVSVEPDASAEWAWTQILRTREVDDPLRMLADALVEVAEAFQEWRHRHLVAVQRSLGDKPGSGGSSGLDWLATSAARTVFPDLWSARTQV